MAFTAVGALVEQLKVSEAEDKDSILEEVAHARQIPFRTRETEPFMRNAVRYIETELGKSDYTTVKELQELASRVSNELFDEFNTSKRRTAEVGSRCIRPGYTALTLRLIEVCSSGHEVTSVKRIITADAEGKAIRHE